MHDQQNVNTAYEPDRLPSQFAFYFAILVVIVNLLVDISYSVLNPKVRAGS